MRSLVAVCWIGALALLLSGCVQKVSEKPEATNSTTPGADAKKVELTLFTWTEVDEYKVNQELVKQFEAKHPNIKVAINNISGSREAMQKLETMFANNKGPDVMSLHGAYYVGFAEAGVLADLDPLVKDDAEFALNDIHPRLVELCRYNGKLYSLPRYTSVYSIFFNKNLFDAEGLEYPKSGWTWADYLKAAKAMTKDNNKDNKPEQWGCIIDFWGSRLYPWLWSNDADLMDKDRNICTIDSPQAIEALQFVADLRLKHKVAPATTSTERNEALDKFARGTIAMYMSGPWDIQTLNQVPNLKWDVAPMPLKKRPATMLGTENYSIYAKSAHPKEAYELYKFLLSPESQSLMAEKLDKMPSRVSILNGSYLNAEAKYSRKVYVDALEYAQLAANFPEYSQVEGILQAEYDRIWIGQQDIAKGLKAAARNANKKIQELRKSQ